jgi:hypothetical protein
MKHLLLVFLATSAFAGCRENMTSEAATSPQSVAKPKPAYIQIPFHETLGVSWVDAAESFDAMGAALYTMDVQDIERWSVVQLSIVVEGQLTPHQQFAPQWRFNGSSFDEVIVSQEVDAFIEKSYGIVGRDDSLALHMLFRVRRNEIQIARMRLERLIVDIESDDNEAVLYTKTITSNR